jgi:PAS domain S-box-containing protein
MRDFSGKIDRLLRSIEELQRCQVQGSPSQTAMFEATVEELHVTLEELQVVNEELMAKQRALEAERQRYLELFEFAPDGYLTTDPLGIIQEANRAAAALLQVPPASLVGKPLVLFVAPAERQAFSSRLTQLRRGDIETVQGWDLYLQPRRGAPFPAALAIGIVRDKAGQMVGLRWLFRDISDRKRMEALHERERHLCDLVRAREHQLISTDRLVSFAELMASMAHEFNNPLQIITTFAQDLLAEMEASHPHYHALTIIAAEALRCKKLIEDLLEFARPRDTQPAPTAVADVIRKSVDLIASQLERAHIKAVIKVPPNLPQVCVDAQQFQQVLLNLYFNAVEAMPEGGALTVRATARPPHEVVIAVADTGQGIAPEDLPKIFRPFFSKKKTKGMGLGLSICEAIMKAHGGAIEVKSTPGRGTTFYLRVPLPRSGDERSARQDLGGGRRGQRARRLSKGAEQSRL